jgi:alginate O-acetyltransferase complex protein AlgI
LVFSSIEFLWLFMPTVLVLYLVVPPRWRNAWLAAASLGFYVWGAGALLYLFLGSIAINFVAGQLIGAAKDAGDETRATRLTTAAVVVNLLILGFWKYAVFAAGQLDSVIGLFGGDIRVPSIVLPIGISFFTFHGISYVVDIHRGRARPMRKPTDYVQYMAFFPQLIAGPIVRYHEINDQIVAPPPRSERLGDIADGFPRFALGLCKKVLIADQVGPIADAAFAAGGGDLNSTTAWLGVLAYTVQIYFDFSGYSDMAIGLARMFGFRFPENFNRPYSSVSITDFWRRWHMSLSRWFRDYVYVPLGGNRLGTRTTVRNLLFVFLLTGAWHGAAWTFVLWGLFHGVLIVGERLTGINALPDDRAATVRRAATLLLVMLGWVLFRSDGLGEAGEFYRAMVSFDFGSVPSAVDATVSAQSLLALAVGMLSFGMPRDLVLGRVLDGEWTGRPLRLRLAVLSISPWAAITVAAGSFSPFLYFQF